MPTKASTYRFGDEVDQMVRELVEETRRTATEEIRIAIEERWRRVFGRRAADRKGIRRRSEERGTGGIFTAEHALGRLKDEG